LLLLSGLLAIVPADGAEAAAGRRKAPGLLQTDFPVQGACISARFPSNNVALKGLAIRLQNNASVLFDTEMLRLAAGWTGGFITTHGVAFDGAHGAHPQIDGTQQFGAGPGPGWADAQGRFIDPRAEPFGPLPESWCRWNGHYVLGQRVVLSYTVLGTAIREEPASITHEGRVGFVRTFQLEAPRHDLAAFHCEVAAERVEASATRASLYMGTNVTCVALVGAGPKAAIQVADQKRVLLHLPKGSRAGTFKVVLWQGPQADEASFAALLSGSPALADVASGGTPHWPQTVETQGLLNTSSTPDGAYVTDALTAPVDNPWQRRVRFAGLDFFSDGTRAALCTHDGDVWLVSGIDAGLKRLQWRRFASGQYETLGLTIVKDVIYTSGRDQITRYHDLNGDGEADFYENFNNQFQSTEGFHEFVFDLQTDRQGNFYFAKANPVNAGGGGFGNQQASRGNGSVCHDSGCLFKLSPDGRALEVYARGFRAPNGLGVSPDGQVTASDNEGTWVPTTPVHWIQPGQFCGVINRLTPADLSARFVPPLCWLAKNYDNSGGGQLWVTSEHWGPFQGELLHESYGQSSLFLVLKEPLPGGRMQGGVVRLPLKFTSSVMRAKFHPQDGQLYVAGLSEWQSNAGKITGVDRVRYTGKPVYSVRGLKVVRGGVELTFTQPLEPASATDVQNFSGKRWNYERAEHYGSPEFSVADPAKRGRDPLEITSSKLSEDGRVVTLAIAELKPVMQQTLKFNLKAADGTPVAQEIMHTIHVIP
jgi:glucose/arabinose dehydrogenase